MTMKNFIEEIEKLVIRLLHLTFSAFESFFGFVKDSFTNYLFRTIFISTVLYDLSTHQSLGIIHEIQNAVFSALDKIHSLHFNFIQLLILMLIGWFFINFFSIYNERKIKQSHVVSSNTYPR